MLKGQSSLNNKRRGRDLESLTHGTVDVLVIGGGITGAGVALDAASRGLETVLIEKHDFGFGTSRWSSKLVHGGLRYLPKGEVGIAYHSALERRYLMERNAPHLVHPLAQVTPLASDTTVAQKAVMRAGFVAGDMLRIVSGTSHHTLPRSHYASRSQTLRLVPAALRAGLKGSWVSYDGQMVDDARIVLAVVRSAAREGARVLNYCEAVSVSGNDVQVRDARSGEEFGIHANVVINATGVWAGNIDHDIRVRPARGTHLVFDAATFGDPTGALLAPLAGSISRYLFVLPAPHGRCYLGLTDEDEPGPIPDVPETPHEDVEFLLRNINRSLDVAVSEHDVLGAFTGLRPLIDRGDNESTADLSRRHAILISTTGVVSVVGGKFTEYRLMAEETVDAALEFAHLSARACRTRNLPLVGAPGHRDYCHISAAQLRSLPDPIVRRYGNEAPGVVAQASVDRALEPIGNSDVTRAEVEYAFRQEGALTVDDVLDRRTRIGMVRADRDAAEPDVQEIYDRVTDEDIQGE